MIISISELEIAINFWRTAFPSDQETMSLAKPARALANLYAVMIYGQFSSADISFCDKSIQEAWFSYCDHHSKRVA